MQNSKSIAAHRLQSDFNWAPIHASKLSAAIGHSPPSTGHFVGSALLIAAPLSIASEPPNVVVILADDLGWNAVGYHNQAFVTPNIDRLVAQGVELDRFDVVPMCSPTRAGLMTGRYPIRFGCRSGRDSTPARLRVTDRRNDHRRGHGEHWLPAPWRLR